MKKLRAYASAFVLLIFSCYYCGISLFQHTHISNGVSIVHSHMGGNSQHDHTQEQIAVIDFLSTFQSEYAPAPFSIGSPYFLLESSYSGYILAPYLSCVHDMPALRGPPQA